ncbi:galactose oxidase-like domain-containing protein [Ramlibacter rhizophilus]|nr:galactose oxidase-like domain-containing protein [Ramlibacter rhizophilus]
MNSLRHAAAVLVAVLSVGLAPAQADSRIGAWGSWNTLPFFPVHNHLLPDGRVMLWPGDAGINGDQGMLLDPRTQNLSSVAKAGFDVFCSGHVFLADGRLLVAGGHIANYIGEPRASVYDPRADSWTATPDMNLGRWYPTVTTLANGDALVVSGDVDTSTANNPLPQVYETATNTWRSLYDAQLVQHLYPNMFLAPDGRVAAVGPTERTRLLDTSGTGKWTMLATIRPGGHRDYGAAVMYDSGKILFLGGGSPPTNRAEVLDLNAAVPAWRSVAPMSVARRQVNATVLPDGKVLVTGGTSGTGFNDMSSPVYAAELWDSATEQWTTLAAAKVPRLYHSGAMLLADGTVLTTGGNDQRTPEVFHPPYLFKGARPEISSAPASIAWGQRFTVHSMQASMIAKVTLIRLASVTHSVDMNQRLNVLGFSPGQGLLEVTAPASGNIAPPGHYLLFLVDQNGVPSLGRVVQLGATAAAPTPPQLTGLSPSSAVAGGSDFSLNVAGQGFVAGAAVHWNGSARPTTMVSAGQLTALIAQADIATAGSYSVTARNPGSAASNVLPFTVTEPLPAPPPPQLTGMQPSTTVAGGAGFTLELTGQGFVADAAAYWNGSARPTTVVSATQLTAQIGQADITAAGNYSVTARNPGSAASGALTFTVTAPPPPPPPPSFQLSVSKTGTESSKGLVTSSPAGINCGTNCSASFSEQQQPVVLTATVKGNARFMGWSGAGCSGVGTCTVSMGSNQSVSARFERR